MNITKTLNKCNKSLRAHKEKQQNITFDLSLEKSALKQFTKHFILRKSDEQHAKNSENSVQVPKQHDPNTFLRTIQSFIVKFLEKQQDIKVKLTLTCKMERIDVKIGDSIIQEANFSSYIEIILKPINLEECYINMCKRILENMTTFQRQGSGWTYHSIVKLTIDTVKYKPLGGSSYIPLPKDIADKKAIVNVQNKNDNECFKWAVTSAMYPVEETVH